jgi:hypothetical protein
MHPETSQLFGIVNMHVLEVCHRHIPGLQACNVPKQDNDAWTMFTLSTWTLLPGWLTADIEPRRLGQPLS